MEKTKQKNCKNLIEMYTTREIDGICSTSLAVNRWQYIRIQKCDLV